ncbi:MAG: response regulator transcription factor [Candidatus Omnitrophica bacterium]|nr:response regulator transcription factor [Candidatus Omnitrophota bacterium]
MRILLVEDEEKIAAFIERGLKAEGFAVDIALDGEAGLKHAFMNEYDLIILDVNLPKMSGYEVCKAIREENSRVPILFLTGLGCVEEKVKGLTLGGDDYLTKPFHFDELIARIRAKIRSQEEQKKATQIKIADLLIEVDKHEVFRSGKRVDLSPQEFSLLYFLAMRKNQVVSRTRIMEHVWQKSFDTGTNVVDVHINHLRSKIDKGFEHPMIHTIRGLGYMLKEAA